jgi:hypothetical protein
VRIIRPVTPDEMEQRFPDLVEALAADPDTVSYCIHCDGLRNHTSANCPFKVER